MAWLVRKPERGGPACILSDYVFPGLGESDTAKVEVSRLFKRWCGSGGFLRREGNPPKVRYYPILPRYSNGLSVMILLAMGRNLLLFNNLSLVLS
jgi:hypothetical protein